MKFVIGIIIVAALITAAFGLIAALAWNGAIRAIFDKYYAAGEGIGALVLYAVIVTVIAVVVSIWIGVVAGKVAGKNKK